MLKKIAIADKFKNEKFLLNRALAYIAETLTEKTVPIDFSEYIFVFPTQEAGRLFREKAAVYFQMYGGVTQLAAILPEQLLFDRSDINYSDIHSINDWCDILQNVNPEELQSKIFPAVDYTAETLIAPAEIFSKIRETILLESGLDTEDFIQTLPENSTLKLKLNDYWKLEKIYLDKLGNHTDKAQAIRNSLENPFAGFNKIKKIILIENSELRNSIKIMLDKLSEKIEVIHLINTSENELDDFDSYGCPLTEKMLQKDLPLDAEKQIRTFSNPIREAEKIASFLNKDTLPASVGIMDNELALTLTHMLNEKGIEVYTPNVRQLNSFYWSRLFAAIADLRKKRITFEEIYSLASDNTFTAYLQVDDPVKLLAEIEKLQRDHLIQDLDSLDFFVSNYYKNSDDGKFETAFNFCRSLKNLINKINSVPDDAMPEGLWNFFAEIAACTALENMDMQDAETSLEALKNAVISVREIPDMNLRMLLFKYKLASTPLSGAGIYKDEALNFSGFLDLIWYENPTLILGGISEESFSNSAIEDAFFPEHIRKSLNWSSAWSRFGADIHRFEQLLKQYSSDEFFITFSVASKNGELNTLPRLFFNVSDDKLLKNCRLLFSDALAEKSAQNTEKKQPLKYTSHITDKMPSRISVTAFKKYIECPYTFYLNNILNCQDPGRELFELQPNQSGTMLHNVLENYGKTFSDSIPDTKILKEHCLKELERQFYLNTGFAPNNLALMQNEEIRKNIEAFAVYETNVRNSANQHKIIQIEKKIDVSMQSLIERLPSDWQQDLPPLAAECRDVRLVGKIDRIDSFYDTDNKHIYRILDYKSANKPETPAKVHLTKKCPENFDTETLYAGNDSKGKDVYFCDMQLVIYSLFANFMHDETDIRDDSVIECGYYNLPLDTDETAIEIFSELDNAMLKNGAKTLILLMNRIFAERRFWPPSLKDPYGIAKVYLECDNINDFEINKESK